LWYRPGLCQCGVGKGYKGLYRALKSPNFPRLVPASSASIGQNRQHYCFPPESKPGGLRRRHGEVQPRAVAWLRRCARSSRRRRVVVVVEAARKPLGGDFQPQRALEELLPRERTHLRAVRVVRMRGEVVGRMSSWVAGVSTSRVSPPGPLSIAYGHVGCVKASAFPPPVQSSPLSLSLSLSLSLTPV
jgi:hypothetical protein